MNTRSSTTSFLFRTAAVVMIAMMLFAALPVSKALAAPSYGTVNNVTLNNQSGTVTYGTGGNVTFAVDLTEFGGGSATTTLSAVGLPAGTSVSWSTNPVTFNGNTTVTLTVTTTNTLAAGATAFHVHSSDGNQDSSNRNLTVSAKALTMSGLSVPASKIYDKTTAAVVSGGPGNLQAAENFGTGTSSDGKPYTGDVVSITGTAVGTYNSANVSTASSVTFSGLSLTGAAAGNYTLTIQSAAAATITPKALTAQGTLAASNKVYTKTNAATLTGSAALLASEAAGTGTTSDGKPYTGDTVTLGGAATGTFASVNVANGITVNVTGLTISGSGSGNYTLTQPTLSANITARPLTITAQANTKTYDGTTSSATNASLSSGTIQAGDTAPTWTQTYDNKNAGSGKTLTPNPLVVTDGNSGNNYSYTYSPVTTGVINARALVITAQANTKTYDGTTSSATNATITSGVIQTGDTAPTWTQTYNNQNAGSGKTLTPSTLVVTDGNSGNNYSYAYTSVTTGTINPAAATITVNGYTGTYDGLPHGASLAAATGVNSEDLTASVSLGSTFTDVPGGTANWSFTNGNYVSQNGSASIVINSAAATITINGYTGTYDGLAHGASLAAATGVNSEDLTASVSLGSTFTDVPGGTANWSFTNVNYVSQNGSASIVINPAVATITVNGYTGTYDGLAHGASLAAATGVNSEDLTASVSLGSTFINAPGGIANWSFTNGNYVSQNGSASIVINKANPTLAVTNSPVTYNGLGQAATVDAGSVAGSASNILTGGLATQTNAGTYAVTADFTPTDTTNYNSLVAAPAGNFVINPAAATITVNGYTGTYDGLPHGASLASATGVNGEDLTASVSLGSAFTDFPGGTANWSFTNGNYVSQNGSASIVINPATPVLSVTNSPIIFNGAPQSATLSSGLATGVISNIQYDASATAPTAVGSYAVTADFASSDPNYTDLTGASAGSFVITAKLIPTVTASGGPFDYDGAPHAATVVGSVPGTVSNVQYNNSATVPTHAGTYSVTADFVPTDTVTYENLLNAAAGSITINKVGLTVTADNQSINAGEPDPTFTVSYSGFVNGETAAVLNTAPTCDVSVAHANPGTYPIVCSGGIDDNYSFSYVNGTLSVGFTGGPGNGDDTTGVFRPSNGFLFLKNSNDTGFADLALNYGLGGDYPVVGDWDGNGTVTIGVYRNGSFLLRNSNTVGFAEIVFPFGQPGDQPVAGDWNGDGVDTIGVYRNGTFLLRNSNDAGAVEMTFQLGNPGDVGIAGDWDGDGMDTTGVFRPSNGVIFLKDKNESGFADIALNYGLPGDQPVMGDWNNDGIDTIGIYRTGKFYLRNENTNGFADIVFGLGNPGDMPIAGNWDGLP